jgi:two-component system sensor histidine kinase GlrK
MLLAIGALGYQLWIVARMQRINDELSTISFVAASQLLQMRRDAEEVENITRKYLAVSDESERREWEVVLDDRIGLFDRDFGQLQDVLRTQELPGSITLISGAWAAYQAELEISRQAPIEGGLDVLPPNLEAALGSVVHLTEGAYKNELERIRDQVAGSRAAGSQAAAVSLFAGSLFLALGGLLGYLTLRTINKPLQELTRGTRSVSRGQFFYRLPVKGPHEFAELARDFNAMSERLAELDQMKKDFVSHVSHELKAPLAAIRQTLAVALEQVPGPLNEQQQRLLNLSRQSAERLSAMVANLLDVSKLEAGTMDYEMAPQDLVKLVRSVIDEFALNAAECRVSLSVVANPTGIPVVCDRDRLLQVIGNLVDNALKFSPAGSDVTVNISGRPESQGEFVRLSVVDEGPGVADSHKRDIFEKFHQVKGGRRVAGQGVGLGLAICKTIVEAHHGRIWVEDNPGGGSVFCVELPAATAMETVSCN